jgi:hypothetical protein
MDSKRIIVKIDGDERGFKPKRNIKVLFGPHHFVDIIKHKNGIKFVLGVTHHGVMMDASNVSSQLEEFIWKSRDEYPDYIFD